MNRIGSDEENDVDWRKRFAEEAGLSIEQLKFLENQSTKRQTRQKKDPQEIDFRVILQINPGQKPGIITPNENSNTNSNPYKMTRFSKSTPYTKPPKTVEKSQKKLIITLPKSVDEFYQSYNNFFTSAFPDNEKDAKFIEAKKAQLFELLNNVTSHGGIVNVISNGEKNSVLGPFTECFCLQSAGEVFKLYKKFLLHFEFYLMENFTFKEYHDPTEVFEEANFVSETSLHDFLSKTPLDPKYFQYDILVFHNGQKVIGINNQEISLDRVSEHYKDYKIDIRIQKALDYGFKPRTMRNQPYQMKVGDYRTFQRLSQQYAINDSKIDNDFIQRLGALKDLDVNGTLFKDRVKSEEIFFGVNFDPQDGLLFDYIGEKTNGTFFGFKQQFDLLSYLDHQVPGCSFPQFYFKVKGVWTGGHQENINMCAVNINHGPDASEWYTMEFKYVQDFRQQLKKEYKMDLYAGQGLWYEKLNWFVEQGKYPIKKIIQKKGDIVISGPGTLHWVRSHGIALQSAWNQFPITYNALSYAFHRQEENEKIHFIRSNVIPLKRLTLKLLNHPRHELTLKIKELCIEKITQWIKQEEQVFEELLNEQNSDFGEDMKFEKLDDLQGFCMKCRQQIFIYFLNGKNPSDVICLHCYKKDKGKKRAKRVFIRHEISKILDLIRLTKIEKPFEEISAFCSNYIGNVPFKCSRNLQKVDKEIIFLQKVNNMNKDLNKYDEQRLKQMTIKMKNKRTGSQKQDGENEIKIEEEQKMHNAKESVINQNIEPQKQQNMEFRYKNNVKYYGKRPSQSGWWSFEVPSHLNIVTFQNHTEILKLIEEQEYFTRLYAKREHRQYPSHAYRVVRMKDNPVKAQMIETKEAQFSSDSEDLNTNTRKKNHKDEGNSVKNDRTLKGIQLEKNEFINKLKIENNESKLRFHEKKNLNEHNYKKSEVLSEVKKSISPQRSCNHRNDNRNQERNSSRHQRFNHYDQKRNDRDFRGQQREDNRRQKPYETREYRREGNERPESRYRENKSHDNESRYQRYENRDRDEISNQRYDNRRDQQSHRNFRDSNRDYRDKRNYRDNKDFRDSRDNWNNFESMDRRGREDNNDYYRNERSQRSSFNQRSSIYRNDERSRNYESKDKYNNFDNDYRTHNERQEKEIELQY